MSLRDKTGSKAAPFAGQQLDVHTQPFAFRAPEEDDESVKMSNITNHRASAATPALPAARPQLIRVQYSNFYSIQMNAFFSTPNSQLTENKALPFFYSVQMNSHHSLLTKQSPVTKTRRIP